MSFLMIIIKIITIIIIIIIVILKITPIVCVLLVLLPQVAHVVILSIKILLKQYFYNIGLVSKNNSLILQFQLQFNSLRN